jgi:tRNA A37 threonylcarbamoyladenosine dehydratase
MTDQRSHDPHDRTHRLALSVGVGADALAGLAGRTVALEIDEASAETPAGKLAFLTLCNLVTRLGPYAPRLDIRVPSRSGPSASPIFPHGSSLAEQAFWVLTSAVPMDGLVRGHADAGLTYDVRVSIGIPQVNAAVGVNVGWRGSLALVGEEPVPIAGPETSQSMGCMVASALATAIVHGLQLASVSTRLKPAPRPWHLDAFTLSSEPWAHSLPAGGIVIPRTLLVGAGALGSSYCYALTHLSELRCEHDVVDPDFLEPTNANRQITAAFEAARDGTTAKVDDLARALPSARSFRLKYEEFKTQQCRSAEEYELAVTAVDNTEARRAVALDLPRVLIDGATGGLSLAIQRGADPVESCVACTYPEVKTDEDGIWTTRLGVSRERVRHLRATGVPFSDEDLSAIQLHGTLELDDGESAALRREGFAHLLRAQCGQGKPDRSLPSASVSYVSALCGFLMAAQAVAEAAGRPTLVGGHPRWAWDDILKTSPVAGQRVEGGQVQSCVERHPLRSSIYRRRWRC